MKNKGLFHRISLVIYMSVYGFLLLNNSLFIHSHWSDSTLIAVHAHPYFLDFSDENKKSQEQHSSQEYELLYLLYQTIYFDLDFTEVNLEIEGKIQAKHCVYSPNLNLDPFLPRSSGRSPPFFS